MQTTSGAIIKLIEGQSEGLAGSIYIPTHPDSSVANTRKDRVRFKNAIQAIRRHPDFSEQKLGGSMKQLELLHDDMEFWSHQDTGLAVLFNEQAVEHFKLPFEITERVYLKNRFVISPLLIMDAVNMNYFVLDVNVKAPKLFVTSGGSLAEVNQDGMPGSLEEEVGKGEYRKQLQHQRGGTATYHGHTEDDAVTDELRRYLKLLAGRVDEFLQGRNLPLLIAGTDNRVGSIRKEINYKIVSEEGYIGSVERMNPKELYDATAPLMQGYFEGRRDSKVSQLEGAAPGLVAVGKEEIVDITKQERGGRIDSLFLPIYRVTKDNVRAGDNRSLVIELPDAIDEVEELVVAVASTGGELVPVEIGAYELLEAPKALCRY